ncbi:WAT1-related protein At5g64700 [Macadamia integrifolia]|uniref:WAT1-related protein At5g64700 n=1 Tax=Macadamia integrifolia TaxID=60698 RepID=UPI001C4F9EA2|nr:WAT1-related protein At5g64700 [Macadamia integrifolia]
MDGKKPYLAAILIQFIYAGMFILSKAAFNGGMDNFVFVFYRQAAATIFLVPLAVIFERKTAPPLSFKVFCKIFALSLCGITLCLNIYNVALIYTSATLAAATANTLPVITFFLAVLLRMEAVNFRTLSGNVKSLGVILCMAGAATLAFYKGPHLKPLTHLHLLGQHNQGGSVATVHATRTWIKGVFIMLSSNTLWGLWIVLQGLVLKSYPSKLLLTTLQCFLSSIQSFVLAIIFSRNLHKWKLHWDIGLVAVAYCGFMVTGVSFYLQSWCIEMRGPVFLAMSTPLSLIITMFCSSLFMGEVTSLGSVLGGIFLVGGLFAVLWGKSKEVNGRKVADDNSEKSTIKDVKHSLEPIESA